MIGRKCCAITNVREENKKEMHAAGWKIACLRISKLEKSVGISKDRADGARHKLETMLLSPCWAYLWRIGEDILSQFEGGTHWGDWATWDAFLPMLIVNILDNAGLNIPRVPKIWFVFWRCRYSIHMWKLRGQGCAEWARAVQRRFFDKSS